MDNNVISPLDIFRWTMIGIISMVAILANGFIVVVSGNRWLQNSKAAPSDFLLTSLSVCRILFYVTLGLLYVLEISMGDTYVYTSAYEGIMFAWMFSSMACLWCASWLSVFYCVKVTNFANGLFLWLKPRINALSVRLLGVSISSLVVLAVPFYRSYAERRKWCNLTGSLPPVDIGQRQDCKELFLIFYPYQVFSASINFTISITASILLLTSLWKHTQNLKKSGIGAKDLNARIHITVIKPLVFYVFLYLLYFSGMLMLTLTSYFEHILDAKVILSDILFTTFPSAHTIMLILTNPKLKAPLLRILNIRQKKRGARHACPASKDKKTTGSPNVKTECCD